MNIPTSVEEEKLQAIAGIQRVLSKREPNQPKESLRDLSLVLVGVLISIPKNDRKNLTLDVWGVDPSIKPIVECLLNGGGSTSKKWFGDRGCKFVGAATEWLMKAIQSHYAKMFLESSASSVARQIIGDMTPERIANLESYVAELKRAMSIKESEVEQPPRKVAGKE